MFFLLRMAFWLSIVLILLPSSSAQHTSATDVDAADAISAASATVRDLRGFCERQPDACSVGTRVAVAMGYKAQADAKMIYDFLTEKLAARDAATSRKTGPRGAVAAKAAPDNSAAKASQNTLTPADVALPWRGPVARKDGKHTA